MLLSVVIPSALLSAITGMRLAVSEMVGANSGLGYLVINSQSLMRVDLLYVGGIIPALLGILANQLPVWLERALTSWKVDPSA